MWSKWNSIFKSAIWITMSPLLYWNLLPKGRVKRGNLLYLATQRYDNNWKTLQVAEGRGGGMSYVYNSKFSTCNTSTPWLAYFNCVTSCAWHVTKHLSCELQGKLPCVTWPWSHQLIGYFLSLGTNISQNRQAWLWSLHSSCPNVFENF